MLAISVPRGSHPTSQTVKATLGLRELVLAGAFEPGDRVRELPLVEELGVSRAPLRIALVTLAHEGLLETLPGGGFAVRRFAREDVDDAIELRGVLEGTAARLAAERLDHPSELEPLRECSAALDVVVHDRGVDAFVRYVALNETFHARLLALAKSPALERAMERILTLPFASPSAFVAVHVKLSESREILVVAQHQHRALLEAVERREGARAEALALEHARLARMNLDLALRDPELCRQLPGATLIRIPVAGYG